VRTALALRLDGRGVRSDPLGLADGSDEIIDRDPFGIVGHHGFRWIERDSGARHAFHVAQCGPHCGGASLSQHAGNRERRRRELCLLRLLRGRDAVHCVAADCDKADGRQEDSSCDHAHLLSTRLRNSIAARRKRETISYTLQELTTLYSRWASSLPGEQH